MTTPTKLEEALYELESAAADAARAYDLTLADKEWRQGRVVAARAAVLAVVRELAGERDRLRVAVNAAFWRRAWDWASDHFSDCGPRRRELKAVRRWQAAIDRDKRAALALVPREEGDHA